jgi:uncharacterized membrane-anchored protein
MKLQNIILWLMAALVLVVVNMLTFQRENLAANGQIVYMELAPVDPRSLIQGDYMQLRYAISWEVEDQTEARNGYIVVQLDQNNVANYVRIHNKAVPLSENEILIRYRQRTDDVRIGPESFFFQEGHAQYYEDAEYAELRVSKSGEVLIVGLRGEDLRALGPP